MDSKTKKQPEIKDGKLMIRNEKIDIDKLVDLFTTYDAEDIVKHCTNLAIVLGEIGLYATEDSIDVEELRCMLPSHDSIYFLKNMVEAFK